MSPCYYNEGRNPFSIPLKFTRYLKSWLWLYLVLKLKNAYFRYCSFILQSCHKILESSSNHHISSGESDDSSSEVSGADTSSDYQLIFSGVAHT